MSSRTRIPRTLGARGYVIITTLVVITVAVQTTLIGVVASFASDQVDEAAEDTYAYVGDLTVERVASFTTSGRNLVDATAAALSLAPQTPHEQLMEAMAQGLDRAPSVGTLYVGWRNGDFFAMSPTAAGYETQWLEHGTGVEVVTQHDANLAPLDAVEESTDYDPRERPWYEAATGATGTVWSEAYLDYGGTTTLASPARAVRSGGAVDAVVAADLDVDALSGVLDDLPYGDGAQAYVVSQAGAVIAAPTSETTRLEALAEDLGRAPTVADLGLAGPPAKLAPGEQVLSRDGEQLVLDQALPAGDSANWSVHLTAEASQLSAGLGQVGTALVWVVVLALVVGAIAVALAWNTLRSMGTMRRRAVTDQLTGLANRHAYEDEGRDLLLQAAVRGERVVAVVIDLDGFKRVNDDLGHEVGDEVLAAAGAALRGGTRGSDVAARVGGDEFVVLHMLERGEDPQHVAQRLRDAVQDGIHSVPGAAGLVGATAGYAQSKAGMELEALVGHADRALMEGKRSAKGRVYRT